MSQTFLIAGKHAGSPVKGNALVQPVFQNLSALARQKNNYWAQRAVETLKSLSSGHIKSNVFVSEEIAGATRREFTMVLPGCIARVVKNSRGEYLVYQLEADTAYEQMQKDAQKPGLYRATKEPLGWITNLQSDGKVLNQRDRMVAITDRTKDPDIAANRAVPFMEDAPTSVGRISVQRDGFDLHFTPGKSPIGGLRNIRQALNAAQDPELRESGLQLAYTMAAAKGTKSVRWVSVQGGSGVLTQAMRILREQNVRFQGAEHYVFFSRLTTLAGPAEGLARELGFEFSRETKDFSRLNLNELIGGTGLGLGNLAAAWRRHRGDPEHTALRLGSDVAREVAGLAGGGKALAATAVATGAALGVATATGGAALGLPASITFATAVFGSVAGVAPPLVKAWLPHYYNKIARRL